MRVYQHLLFSTLALLSVGCSGGNSVRVNGTVKDQLGAAVSGATIQVTGSSTNGGLDACCAGNEKPCSYTTDSKGSWTLYYVTGAIVSAAADEKDTCAYTVAKSGYTTKVGSWQYVVRGPSAGNQTITTDVSLAP